MFYFDTLVYITLSDVFYYLSASPERYISKNGTTIISQPIKGTAKRHSDHIEDEKLKNELTNDPKVPYFDIWIAFSEQEVRFPRFGVTHVMIEFFMEELFALSDASKAGYFKA